MATLNIQVLGICGGGEHADISVSLNGGAPQTFHVGIDDLRSAFDPQNRDAVLHGILKLAVLGLTKIQARTKLQAGFTVTV